MHRQTAPPQRQPQQQRPQLPGGGGCHTAAGHLGENRHQTIQIAHIRTGGFQRPRDQPRQPAGQIGDIAQRLQRGKQHHKPAHIQHGTTSSIHRARQRCRRTQERLGRHRFPLYRARQRRQHPHPESQQQRCQQMRRQQHRAKASAAKQTRSHGADNERRSGVDAKQQHTPPLPSGDGSAAQQLPHRHTARGIATHKADQNARRTAAGQSKQHPCGALQSSTDGGSHTGAGHEARQHQKRKQRGDHHCRTNRQSAADAAGHRLWPAQQRAPYPHHRQQQNAFVQRGPMPCGDKHRRSSFLSTAY